MARQGKDRAPSARQGGAAAPAAQRVEGRAGVPQRAAPIAPARVAAFAILTKVATTAAHSDDLLHAPAVNALAAEDRNLTTALVLGVLRWQLALDARVRPLLQRPDAELHPAALLALRLGIFQLEYMQRIPAHAAINESVELARANGAEHAAGMVNALLRRMMREREGAVPARRTLAAASPEETAHPQWLLQRWRARYGGKATRLIAGYDQAEPPQHGLFADGPGVAGGVDGASQDVVVSGLPRIDDGSRLVAEIAVAAVPGAKRILDLCAAPGGKTLVLAHRLADAEIVAADVNEKRLGAMRKRLDADAAGVRVRTVLADMAARHLPAVSADAVEESSAFMLKDGFDLVLCDAPCSGTGTLARNPEIRHRLREGDLPRQAERQGALLRSALRRMDVGGRVVYSTCSLEPEENEALVAAVVADGGVRRVPVGPLLQDVGGLREEVRARLPATAVTAEGALRTLPGVHACDGFYAVVLERV